LIFGNEDLVDDGDEFIAPTTETGGVLAVEAGEGLAGFFEVGPPLERAAAVGEEHDDVQWGFEVDGAAAFEIEIRYQGMPVMPRWKNECGLWRKPADSMVLRPPPATWRRSMQTVRRPAG
jgi:hypothetical protein